MNEKDLIIEIQVLKSLLEKEKKKNIRLKKQLRDARNSITPQKAGRGRPRIDNGKVFEIKRLNDEGKSIRKIQAETGVSIGSISKILREYHASMPKHQIIDFMYEDELCTRIQVDYRLEKITLENRTDDILHRAFGCRERVEWRDFQEFLEERCFPPTRDRMKDILRELEVPHYDPLQIIQITQGRMAEDKQWLHIHECAMGGE